MAGARGLICSTACRIFSDQGSDPVSCTGRRILHCRATRQPCHHGLSRSASGGTKASAALGPEEW